jgi:hypothetical protein
MNSAFLEENGELTCDVEIPRLERKLRDQLRGRVRNFCVRLQGHGLILQGSASTYHAKQLAQHVIMKATRVPIVANDIEVADAARE